MYLLFSRYTAPRERIEELVPAHRAYLRRHFDAGVFVVSGRRVPWEGGVVVARGVTREELDAIVAEDPFAQAGAAETEVVEFEPLFAGDGFEQLLAPLERHGALRVLGVDGCPGGWAVVELLDGVFAGASVARSFRDVLERPAAVVAVDIPIGLPTTPPRPADTAARAFVRPRGSSVFPTAPRAVLEAPTYAEARERALRLTGKSLSAQAYAIGPKILEVDECAERDERVVEVHPECSFRELAGRPLVSKHTPEGRRERRELLRAAGIDLPARVPGIDELDLLDGAAAAWSAVRYARGEAVSLPAGHSRRIGAIWR